METSYGAYSSQWNQIRKRIELSNYLDIHEVNLYDYNGNFIFEGKIYENIVDNEKKLDFFKKSRKYAIDEIKSGKYDCIIELGSGWGSNIFYFYTEYPELNIDVISGEYTMEGVETQKYVKDKYFSDKNLSIYSFNYLESFNFFKNLQNKYKNALILTFWSIEQVTELKNDFFDNLFNTFTSFTCFNLEPIGWQISSSSLSKSWWYYNTNLYQKLKDLENQKKIKINKIILDFYNNGRNETSGTLIEWKKI